MAISAARGSFSGQWRKLYRGVTETVVVLVLVAGPWALGSTRDWAVRATNIAGFFLLAVWLANRLVSFFQADTQKSIQSKRKQSPLNQIYDVILLGTVALLLVYAFLGAWNARSIYHLWWLEYRPYIPWLPHSYDQSKSWDYLLQFLGLAGIFLAARDWLCFGHNHSISAPPRLHRLLWIISINGGLLALEGLVQRLSGETRLLWLVEPFVNKTADAQFGPFAYRANAAQYFNLLWPVSLAFWLALRKRAVDASGSFWQRHRCKFLMVSILLMALCPAVALSRAGWSVLVFELVIASVIVTLSLRKGSTNVGGAVALAVVIVLGVGFYLEGERLWSRFQTLEEGYNDRAALYSVGDQISDDNPVFGVGGGAFSTVYQFYRVSLDDYLPAQMHNDWLEALINLGWVGLIVSLLPLLGILFRWFLPGGGIRVEWPTICLFWLGMGGCMLHACVDFPFQIESILVLFTVYCSQLSVFSRA